MNYLRFNVYADGGEEVSASVPLIIESARNLQRLGHFYDPPTFADYLSGEEWIEHDEILLIELFERYKKSDMLLFPYELDQAAVLENGLISIDDEYGIGSVDRYTLHLELKQDDHPREALRFGLASKDQLAGLPRGMIGRYFKQNNDMETVILGVDEFTVSLLANDIDLFSDSALETKFKEALINIGKNKSLGQVSQELEAMIAVEWIMTAGAEEWNVYDGLVDFFSNGVTFRNYWFNDTREIYSKQRISKSDVRDLLQEDDDFDTLILEIFDSLEDSGFDLESEFSQAAIIELLRAILNSILFEHGYLDAIAESKLRAVKEAYDDLPIRRIQTLDEIVSESKNAGAYVLEVGMSWGKGIEFMLNPTSLEKQGLISVADQNLYFESYG